MYPNPERQSWQAKPGLALAICAVAALAEGFDNQAMGVAGPGVIREFHLAPDVAGWLFSLGTLGQAVGATLGGYIADRITRKWALVVSLLLLGAGCLGIIVAEGTQSLFAMRAVTGLGLGGALPNFINLATEAVPASQRLRLVTLLMAALPAGGTLAAVTGLAHSMGWSWRSIFVVGGTVPLLVSAVALALPRGSAQKDREAMAAANSSGAGSGPSPLSTLFGEGRAPTTLWLWVGLFFIQLILLLMLNWLPTLLVRAGFSSTQASGAQIGFSIGGAIGGFLIGRLQSSRRQRLGVLTTYLGVAAALATAGLALGDYRTVVLASAVAGLFIIGAQLAMYAAAPLYYPRAIRGTGVGCALAVGRLGSVVGPLFAGFLVAAGGTASTVFLGIEPFVLIAGAAAIALCSRRQAPG